LFARFPPFGRDRFLSAPPLRWLPRAATSGELGWRAAFANRQPSHCRRFVAFDLSLFFFREIFAQLRSPPPSRSRRFLIRCGIFGCSPTVDDSEVVFPQFFGFFSRVAFPVLFYVHTFRAVYPRPAGRVHPRRRHVFPSARAAFRFIFSRLTFLLAVFCFPADLFLVQSLSAVFPEQRGFAAGMERG